MACFRADSTFYTADTTLYTADKACVSQNVVPSTGVLTVIGFAAIVFASNLINVTPALGEVAFGGFAPTVSISDKYWS